MPGTKKVFRSDGAARTRDYAIATWAVVDSLKKVGPMWPAAAVTAIVMSALLLYALVVKLWPVLLAIAAAWLGGKYLKYRAEKSKEHRPVPWDDDYKEDEDEIPY